jgi:hypothetical protein
VINTHLLGGTGIHWEPLHAVLRADNNRLHQRLLRLRRDAGLGEHVSALRILDVLAWMDGRGWADKTVAGRPVQKLAALEETTDAAIDQSREPARQRNYGRDTGG